MAEDADENSVVYLPPSKVVEGLTKAGMPPDRMIDDEPQWFSDYGGSSLMDAYRAGYLQAVADQRLADGLVDLAPTAAAYFGAQSAGFSTCPVCTRTWEVTPHDDCMMPACGCFGTDASAANPARPCEGCGLRHAMDGRHFGFVCGFDPKAPT